MTRYRVMSDWDERFSAHRYRKPQGPVVVETMGGPQRYPGLPFDIWPLKLVEGEILRTDGSPIEQLGYTPPGSWMTRSMEAASLFYTTAGLAVAGSLRCGFSRFEHPS